MVGCFIVVYLFLLLTPTTDPSVAAEIITAVHMYWYLYKT